MRIHEFVDEGRGHSSYLIDLGNETAAVVDPPRFPTAHEQLAEQLGVRLAWSIDTHSHADDVTGSPGLVARRDAVFMAPAASNLETPHRPVVDGDDVELTPEIALMALAAMVYPTLRAAACRHEVANSARQSIVSIPRTKFVRIPSAV